jgi:hypothetical protein
MESPVDSVFEMSGCEWLMLRYAAVAPLSRARCPTGLQPMRGVGWRDADGEVARRATELRRSDPKTLVASLCHCPGRGT